METPDHGLVTVAYAPSEVHANLAGNNVSVTEETEYPFRGDVQLTVHTGSTITFPIVLRIPAWAESATVEVNGKPAPPTQNNVRNGFCSVRREWRDGDIVAVSFPMQERVSHSFHNSTMFERGPLVFSLPLEGKWTELKKYAQRSADWQITPTTKWNYAVELGECAVKISEHKLGDTPFDMQQPAVTLQVEARELPEWTIRENSAGPLPVSPVNSDAPLDELILIPYGAAKLRITAFPYLNERSKCDGRKALVNARSPGAVQ
jgi:hypothetical protein